MLFKDSLKTDSCHVAVSLCALGQQADILYRTFHTVPEMAPATLHVTRESRGLVFTPPVGTYTQSPARGEFLSRPRLETWIPEMAALL